MPTTPPATMTNSRRVIWVVITFAIYQSRLCNRCFPIVIDETAPVGCVFIADHAQSIQVLDAALIETAVIHRRHLGKPRTARRLLDTAIERAKQLENEALVERARNELDELPALRGGDEQ